MKANVLLSSFLLLVPIAGCAKEEAKFPPATGPEAASLPKLPKIEHGNRGGSVSPSEGKTTGTTYAKQEAQLGPTVGGIMTELSVQEGDRVKKGDVLFKQDARDAVLRAFRHRLL